MLFLITIINSVSERCLISKAYRLLDECFAVCT